MAQEIEPDISGLHRTEKYQILAEIPEQVKVTGKVQILLLPEDYGLLLLCNLRSLKN